MSSTDRLNVVVKQIAHEEDLSEDDAFVVFVLRDLLELESSVYEDALRLGGSGDCGIDGFWDDGEAINILQAKFEKNPITEEKIDNFWNCLLYLRGDASDLADRCKEAVKDLRFDFEDLEKAGREIKLLFVSKASLSPSAKKKVELLRESNPEIQFETWDAEELLSKVVAQQRNEPPVVGLSIAPEEFFESRGIGDVEAPFVVASVKGNDLFEAYRKYSETIFLQNLRFFLGKSGKINKGIQETLNDPKKRDGFWYFNNGLTILCDNFTYDKKKEVLTVSNMQIVNGAQTTRSISEAIRQKLGRDKALNIKVVARIIKVPKGDTELIKDIRDFNNRQNPTKPRDFVSHEAIQHELQLAFEKFGYYYEIKRGEKLEANTKSKIAKKKLEVIDNLTVAQARLATLGKPAEAKSKRADILDPTEPFYYEIFHKDVSVSELLFAYKCYEKAQKEVKNFKKDNEKIKQADEYKVHGTTHIVALMGLITGHWLDQAQYFMDPRKLKLLISDKVINELYNLADLYLKELYKEEIYNHQAQDESLVPSKIFKNTEVARKYLEKVRELYFERDAAAKQKLMEAVEPKSK